MLNCVLDANASPRELMPGRAVVQDQPADHGQPHTRRRLIPVRFRRHLGRRPRPDPGGGRANRGLPGFRPLGWYHGDHKRSVSPVFRVDAAQQVSRPRLCPAGIPVELHEDSSQTVYATLLQRQGRDRFVSVVSKVGYLGINNVFTRETNQRLEFLRAVDMVKKRAQREREFRRLGSADVAESSSYSTRGPGLKRLEAIDQVLSRRDAGLIRDTLMGKTPAEIALEWGLTPKTVSNEKTRAIQKLARRRWLRKPNDRFFPRVGLG